MIPVSIFKSVTFQITVLSCVL